MYITKLVAAALAAVESLAVRPSAPRTPGWLLFASLMPLSLIAGAVLALLPSQAYLRPDSTARTATRRGVSARRTRRALPSSERPLP